VTVPQYTQNPLPHLLLTFGTAFRFSQRPYRCSKPYRTIIGLTCSWFSTSSIHPLTLWPQNKRMDKRKTYCCIKWVVYDYSCLSCMVYFPLNMKEAESLHTEIKSLDKAKKLHNFVQRNSLWDETRAPEYLLPHKINIIVFWDMIPSTPRYMYLCFKGTYWLLIFRNFCTEEGGSRFM